MKTPYIWFAGALLLFSGLAQAQSRLFLGISPGLAPGPSVLRVALVTEEAEGDIKRAWLAFKTVTLIEIRNGDRHSTEEIILAPLPEVEVFRHSGKVSVRRLFRAEPALAEGSRWQVELELDGIVLFSNQKNVERSSLPIEEVAQVAILLKDSKTLAVVGETLIKDLPRQTHGYLYRGLAKEMQGRLDEAEADIQRAKALFYELSPPTDATGRYHPRWEPPEILNRALRRIRAAQEG